MMDVVFCLFINLYVEKNIILQLHDNNKQPLPVKRW